MRSGSNACGLTQEQFAEKVGKSRGAISLYEKGERTPDIEFLWDVVSAFVCDYSDLMGLTDRMKYQKTGIDSNVLLSGRAVEIVRNYAEEINFLAGLESVLEDIFEAISVYRSPLSVESIALTGAEYVTFSEFAEGALSAGIWEAQKEGYMGISERARSVLKNRIAEYDRWDRTFRFTKRVNEIVRRPADNADKVIDKMVKARYSTMEIMQLKRLEKFMEEGEE